MLTLMVCSLVAVVFLAATNRRLRRFHISGAVAMVVMGIFVGLFLREQISEHLNTDIAEHLVELILAVLLFVDATEVRGGFLAGRRSVVVRLLVLALPISLMGAVLLGAVMLGTTDYAVLLVIACVVLPIDFAASPEMLRDRKISASLREGVAVESGYNDGIFSPVFAFALLLAGGAGPGKISTPIEALENAVPAAIYAVVVGVGIGGVCGTIVLLARHWGWSGVHGARIVMLLVPFITYECAVHVEGNGFVAAFLAGITYRMARLRGNREEHTIPAEELSLVDDVSMIGSAFMWFIVGAVTALIFATPVQWGWIAYAFLALTVLRLVPVMLAFIGSRVSLRERVAVSYMGPRGTSSIVFGLLAFNALNEDDANIVLYVTVNWPGLSSDRFSCQPVGDRSDSVSA
ncbi:cation:proton antiporter [Leucobacter ruminantium]|uniref:Cation:proton antiporter n=1 Tax=Leucobacter ruminantium TaxID=1289170 RepID=A0A939LY10_9MICO|nr:cation:proton antiporter [Leucobacter ruminantium]MBO1806562.1 cation:proton antiporter [Leucobacter ruminantium]